LKRQADIIKPGKKLIIGVLAFLPAFAAMAQKEGMKKQTIDITSSFKPVLRNAAKINLNATPPSPDSSKPRLTYNIPDQQLFTTYQSIGLKPLALQIDSISRWKNSNSIKVGYGNYQTPYLRAGFSFGDGQKSQLNIFGNYISSSGKIKNQAYSQAGAGLSGFTQTASGLEWSGKFGLSQDKYHLYGYDHTLYDYSKSQTLQSYNTFSASAGLRNLEPTEFGLRYNPNLKISLFSDNRKANESNAVLNLPLEKSIGSVYAVKVGFGADFTRYKPAEGGAINNNIYYIPAAILFKTPNFFFHGGVIPSWDNGKFKLLPDFTGEFKLGSDKLMLQFGWISYFEKGSYERWSSINPYIYQPTDLYNTRLVEKYGGIRGALTERLTYNFKLGAIRYNYLPLFVNDSADQKSFRILREEKLEAFQFQGEIAWSMSDRFDVSAGINLLKFKNQLTYDEAYGMIPSKLNASLKWQVLNDLWFKSDLFYFTGNSYRDKNGDNGKVAGAVDLNAGLEFRITKQLNLWLQMNNIFNKKYQRWSNYEVYGFNALLGVVFNFDQK